MSHPQPPGEGQGYPPSLDDNPAPRSPPASRLGASPSPTDRTTPRPAETVQHNSPLANPTSPAVDPASPSRSPDSRATPGAATRDAPQRNLDDGPLDASSELVPFPSLATSKSSDPVSTPAAPSDPVSTQVANHPPPESTDAAKDFLDDWQQQLRASRRAIQAAQEVSAQRRREREAANLPPENHPAQANPTSEGFLSQKERYDARQDARPAHKNRITDAINLGQDLTPQDLSPPQGLLPATPRGGPQDPNPQLEQSDGLITPHPFADPPTRTLRSVHWGGEEETTTGGTQHGATLNRTKSRTSVTARQAFLQRTSPAPTGSTPTSTDPRGTTTSEIDRQEMQELNDSMLAAGINASQATPTQSPAASEGGRSDRRPRLTGKGSPREAQAPETCHRIYVPRDQGADDYGVWRRRHNAVPETPESVHLSPVAGTPNVAQVTYPDGTPRGSVYGGPLAGHEYDLHVTGTAPETPRLLHHPLDGAYDPPGHYSYHPPNLDKVLPALPVADGQVLVEGWVPFPFTTNAVRDDGASPISGNREAAAKASREARDADLADDVHRLWRKPQPGYDDYMERRGRPTDPGRKPEALAPFRMDTEQKVEVLAQLRAEGEGPDLATNPPMFSDTERSALDEPSVPDSAGNPPNHVTQLPETIRRTPDEERQGDENTRRTDARVTQQLVASTQAARQERWLDHAVGNLVERDQEADGDWHAAEARRLERLAEHAKRCRVTYAAQRQMRTDFYVDAAATTTDSHDRRAEERGAKATLTRHDSGHYALEEVGIDATH